MFRTYEPTRDRLIAVKVFRLDITPEQAQALANELSVAAEAGLFHPSIVEPVAAGVEGTVAFRAEEYVAAESLDAAIRHYAPASFEKALPFITQLAGAIDFARAAGVGHGALHLRDIFVTPEEARASGFGVVEALERVGLRAPVRRPYSAPERIAGQPWGIAADVFSLAAISFELLTGTRPSGTGDRMGSLAGANLGEYEDGVRQVLARGLADDPAARHPSALAFASALEAAAHGRRVTSAIDSVGAIAAAAPAAGEEIPEPDGPAFDAEETFDREAHFGIDAPLAREMPADIDEAAAGLVLHPADAAGEDDADDIASEREFDEMPGLLAFDDSPDEPLAHRVPEYDERDADDGLVVPAAAAHDAVAAPPPDRAMFGEAYREERDDLREPVVGPPRRPVLPMALMLVLGLLVGFAAGHAIGARSVDPGESASAAGEGQAAPGAAAPGETPASTPGPERAFSEQAVTPPPAPPEPAPAAPPPAVRGQIIVRSTPSRAAVTVNGTWRGRTPLTLDGLAPGPYSLRIVQEGYDVAEEQVRLTAAAPSSTVNVRLERRAAAAPRRPAAAPRPAPDRTGPYTGSIYVDSRPRGARVLVDGKAVGTTPLLLPDVPSGSHVVRLELEDHRAWTSSTRVTAGAEARVTGSLERIR